MRLCVGFLLLAGLLLAQSVDRHRISLSGGWGEQIARNFFERQSAPVVGASYGYRVTSWVELEAGLTVAFQPAPDQCRASGCFNPNDHFFWVPFGVRFIAPIAWKRVELSAGGGGLYEKYSVSNADLNFQARDGWGGHFVGGAAVAISRHIWLGASPRFYLANPAYARDRWFVITGDVNFRF